MCELSQSIRIMSHDGRKSLSKKGLIWVHCSYIFLMLLFIIEINRNEERTNSKQGMINT